MDQKSAFEIIMASSVISAIISGIISLLISKMQYKNSLKLNRNDKKLELSVTLFNELQQSLKKIDDDISSEKSSGKSLDCNEYQTALMIGWEQAKERIKLAREVLDQISYLISERRRCDLENEYSKLHDKNAALISASIRASGKLPIFDTSEIEEIDPNKFDKVALDYMREVSHFLDAIKEEIINTLRTLCGT